MTITATYSPEDNKIRLYPSKRLDAETYARVKEAGFRWAPKQELFVAPSWSCTREDLAIELAGEIEPEEMTLAERAQMKAERLDGIAERRAQQASAFAQAARDISARFASGQPILKGHHSERKALKDRERADAAQSKAKKAHEAIDYWLYRAESVERHANYKNDPRVRANRIKKLLADLRDYQRRLNTAHKMLERWQKLTTDNLIKMGLNRDPDIEFGLYFKVDKGEMTPQEARQRILDRAQRVIDAPNLRRYITHTLNRLAYERELLGPVARFEGEITPTLLQMFVREHGADKPKGAKIDDDLFSVECDAPLPAHIGLGESIELSGDEWRDLMQSCGYCPAEKKKPALPPILNFASPSGSLEAKNRAIYRGADPVESFRQVSLTKAEYAAINSDYRGTRNSLCGQYRFRIALDPNPPAGTPHYSRGYVAVFISDQKAHAVPDSVYRLEAAE